MKRPLFAVGLLLALTLGSNSFAQSPPAWSMQACPKSLNCAFAINGQTGVVHLDKSGAHIVVSLGGGDWTQFDAANCYAGPGGATVAFDPDIFGDFQQGPVLTFLTTKSGNIVAAGNDATGMPFETTCLPK